MKIFRTLLILCLIALSYSFMLKLERSEAAFPASHSESFGKLGTFSFTDSAGQVVSDETVKGKTLVINFFFSSCKGICPTLNGNVKQLVNEFSVEDNIEFLSISVDPENDTAERLTEYRKSFKAPSFWRFLNAPLKDVKSFLSGNVKLANGDKPDLHSTRLVHVDQTGEIRGYYRGLEQESVKDLLKALKAD